MSKKKDNPGPYVTQIQCITKHEKTDLALFGADGRGGIVKDISDIRSQVTITSKEVTEFVKNHKQEVEEKGRDWRSLGFAILGSVISGVIIATVTYFL